VTQPSVGGRDVTTPVVARQSKRPGCAGLSQFPQHSDASDREGPSTTILGHTLSELVERPRGIRTTRSDSVNVAANFWEN